MVWEGGPVNRHLELASRVPSASVGTLRQRDGVVVFVDDGWFNGIRASISCAPSSRSDAEARIAAAITRLQDRLAVIRPAAASPARRQDSELAAETTETSRAAGPGESAATTVAAGEQLESSRPAAAMARPAASHPPPAITALPFATATDSIAVFVPPPPKPLAAGLARAASPAPMPSARSRAGRRAPGGAVAIGRLIKT